MYVILRHIMMYVIGLPYYIGRT